MGGEVASSKTKALTPANIIVAVVILAVLVGSCLFAWSATQTTGGGLMAVVHDSDGETHQLPLDHDAQLTVTTDKGTNVIAVQNGEVVMVDADCDGHDCIQQGAISMPGTQIICLPHQLWIEIVENGQPQGEMNVEATPEAQQFDTLAR